MDIAKGSISGMLEFVLNKEILALARLLETRHLGRVSIGCDPRSSQGLQSRCTHDQHNDWAESSSETTLNFYTHVTPATHRRAVDDLERVLFSNIPNLDGTGNSSVC